MNAKRVFIVYGNHLDMLLVPGHDCNHFILGGQAVGRIGDDQDAVCKFFEQAVERIRHAV